MTHLTSARHAREVVDAIAPWRVVVLAAAISTFPLLGPSRADAQTLIAAEAYHQRFCGEWFMFRDCQTVATRRITRNFTRQYLNSDIFGGLWGAAAHCLTVSYPTERCAQSVAVFSDPSWSRIVWGQTNQFLLKYGAAGDGVGQFQQPAGVAITRNDGEWHVAFVADVIAGRVAVLGLGYTCRCVRWLGAITAAETGIPLSMPFDVAWDHAGSWTLEDDRVFILDSGNDRVVVYRVSLYPAANTMSQQFLGTFGTRGTGSAQFMGPQGIDVLSFRCGVGGPDLCADVYIADTGNRRVRLWRYDAPNSSTPATSPTEMSKSAPDPAADFTGITHDHYGDVFVSDRAQNRIVKFQGKFWGVTLPELKRYGGSASSWYQGNFVQPASLDVPRAFKVGSNGSIIEEGLPFVSTLERWSDTTGLQTHRLGVDVENLALEASADGSYLYGRFLFTATGVHTWTIYTPSGAPAGSSGGSVPARSGWNYPGAAIGGYGAGTYTLTVQYQSGYMYDDGQWKTKSVSITAGSGNPCDENPWLPECNPCPPPQISCSIVGVATPKVYFLSQDQPIPADALNLDAYRTGLRRVQGTRSLSLRNTGLPAAGSTAADIRVNGITGVQFGVPRPSEDPRAATSSQRGTSAQERPRVQVQIYDIGGRLVRTAVNENLSPGYYQYQWDLLNNRNQRVAPGVYIVVMTAPGFTKSSKLIVTR